MLSRFMAPYVPLPRTECVQPICVPRNVVNAEVVRLLPLEERSQYQSLIDSISNDVQKTRRHSGLTEFVKHISLVHRFIARGNSNDSLRGIVCGVTDAELYDALKTFLSEKSYAHFRRLSREESISLCEGRARIAVHAFRASVEGKE